MIDSEAIKLLPDLLESMRDSIIVDKNGKIIFFSESYATDFGVLSKNAIGRNVQDIISNTRMHIVLETGLEEIAQVFSSVFASDETKVDNGPVHFCNRIPIRKDGDPSGEIIGAFAYTSLANVNYIDKMQKQISNLMNKDILMNNHLSEVYKAPYMLESIKGSSYEISQTKDLIRRVANSNITVTITGETGTGKELVASSIHELSSRKNKSFIKINCAAIPENLIESELFGYEAGSFTGALKSGKIGKFELANHGTILLDEIGEIPLHLQAKLLRVLQEHELDRIGGNSPIPIDVRIICSTNRNIKELINEGKFRSDLYYRINVMEIDVPPLRDRLEDLPELCNNFVEEYNNDSSMCITGIDPSIYNILSAHSWPGNIRELKHVIECACVMANSEVLKPCHFEFLKKRIKDTQLSLPGNPKKSYAAVKSQDENIINFGNQNDLSSHTMKVERNIILDALLQNHGNISATAKELNINRSSLYRKLKRYKIYPYD